MKNEIHLGTTFNFVVTVEDDDGAVDLSTATVKNLIFRRSDDSTVTNPMIFNTDGTDGKLKYVITLNDFTITGLYEYQLYIIKPGVTMRSDWGQFRVYPNLS